MKETYDIHDTWVSYELHPETPPDGMLLSERFKGHDVSSMYDQLRERGKEFGIVFGNCTLISNSRLALEASEYARDMGKYERFHETIFRFYFTDIHHQWEIQNSWRSTSRCIQANIRQDRVIKHVGN